MAKNWIVFEDRLERLTSIISEIRNLENDSKIYAYWMASKAGLERLESTTDFDEIEKSCTFVVLESFLIPNEVSEPSILMLDLIWNQGGYSKAFDTITDGQSVIDWLNKNQRSIAFVHSTGDPDKGDFNVMNVKAIESQLENNRFIACPNSATKTSAIVSAARQAYEKAFSVDSGIDHLLEIFKRNEHDPYPNHNPDYHWGIVEKLLGVRLDEVDKFYELYCGATSAPRPEFSDGVPKDADPIYNSIKELGSSKRAVSAIAAWFLVWGGMRTRILHEPKVLPDLEKFDAICCEALVSLRNSGVNAKKDLRYDYLAGGFPDNDSFVRCVRLLFRIGYDLAVNDETGEVNFKNVSLEPNKVEIQFGFNTRQIVGKMHRVLSPLFSQLLHETEEASTDSEPREGVSDQSSTPTTGSGAVLKRLLALNTVLGFGGSGDISDRRFCHYFAQKGGIFSLGFLRFREPE
jgi:hypothetical protein